MRGPAYVLPLSSTMRNLLQHEPPGTELDEAESEARMNRVRLRQNAFDLWIFVDAADESKAWSGSRSVPNTDEGFPRSDVQVSNLDTWEDAAEYAVSFGFAVIDTIIN